MVSINPAIDPALHDTTASRRSVRLPTRLALPDLARMEVAIPKVETRDVVSRMESPAAI